MLRHYLAKIMYGNCTTGTVANKTHCYFIVQPQYVQLLWLTRNAFVLAISRLRPSIAQ